MLRQLTDEIARADAYLFKPADAVAYMQGGDNGTPLQKDEPQTPNPATGAFIDYYLKTNATGPVTIEILDADGTVLETMGNQVAAAPGGGGRGGRGGRGGGIPNTTILWRQPAAPFATSAGMHRVAWNPAGGRGRGFGGGGGRGGRGGRGAPAPSLPGTFTARLTVNGKSYTQQFMVRPDPRNPLP